MAASREIMVTIRGDASPLMAELRKAEAAMKRLDARQRTYPRKGDLLFIKAMRTGIALGRAIERVKQALASRPPTDESEQQ
jgi:hypothetical protein